MESGNIKCQFCLKSVDSVEEIHFPQNLLNEHLFTFLLEHLGISREQFESGLELKVSQLCLNCTALYQNLWELHEEMKSLEQKLHQAVSEIRVAITNSINSIKEDGEDGKQLEDTLEPLYRVREHIKLQGCEALEKIATAGEIIVMKEEVDIKEEPLDYYITAVDDTESYTEWNLTTDDDTKYDPSILGLGDPEDSHSVTESNNGTFIFTKELVVKLERIESINEKAKGHFQKRKKKSQVDDPSWNRKNRKNKKRPGPKCKPVKIGPKTVRLPLTNDGIVNSALKMMNSRVKETESMITGTSDLVGDICTRTVIENGIQTTNLTNDCEDNRLLFDLNSLAHSISCSLPDYII